MKTDVYYWAAGLISLTIAYFCVPAKLKNIVANVLLVAATAFVGLALASTVVNHKDRLIKSPTVSADQQELMLKLDHSINKMFVMAGAQHMLQQKNGLVPAAEANLEKLSDEQPNSDVIAAKLALVAHEAHDGGVQNKAMGRLRTLDGKPELIEPEVDTSAEENESESSSDADSGKSKKIGTITGTGTIDASKEKVKASSAAVPVSVANPIEAAAEKTASLQAKKAAHENEVKTAAPNEPAPNQSAPKQEPAKPSLYSAINAIYDGKRSPRKHQLNAAAVNSYDALFKEKFPPGWYLDVSRMQLYGAAGQTKKLEELKAAFDSKCVGACIKLAMLTVGAALSGLIGLVAIVVVLFFLPRTESTPESLALIRAPADYGVKNVFGVFIGWITVQNLVGLLSQKALKMHALWSQGSLVAAGSVLALYVVSTAPVLLLLWCIAFKPHGIKLLDGIKLRTNVAGRGPFKLVGIGMLGWFMALPLVALATIIAQRFLHAQGSSNPGIGMVMESARNGSVPIVLLLFTMMAVLAPFFEESLFRGFLYSYLRRKYSVGVSAAISGFIFAAVHLDLGGFFPLFTLGIMFALLFEKTKSIMTSMVTHGMWNSGTILILLLLFQ